MARGSNQQRKCPYLFSGVFVGDTEVHVFQLFIKGLININYLSLSELKMRKITSQREIVYMHPLIRIKRPKKRHLNNKKTFSHRHFLFIQTDDSKLDYNF